MFTLIASLFTRRALKVTFICKLTDKFLWQVIFNLKHISEKYIETVNHYTLRKVHKIRVIFGRSENTAQSFIMGVYEKIFFSVFEVSGTNW